MVRTILGSWPAVQSAISTWPAVKSGVLFIGSYVAWLVVFQRWIEPVVRKCVGTLSRRAIVWVPAGNGFRVWGLRGNDIASQEGAVTLFGCAVVLCAALAPALCGTVGASSADPLLAATRYLTAAPAVAIFTFGVLSGEIDAV